MTQSTPPTILDENEQIKERKAKLSKLKQQGQAYPNGFKRDDYALDLQQAYLSLDRDALAEKPIQVAIAGRMVLQRLMGKAAFFTVQDMTGRLQVYVKKSDLPEGVFDQFKGFDLGDIVGVKGFLFRTKTGELTVHAQQLQLLTKALRPLPDKHKGLTDPEMRARQRYVDLVVNEHTRKTFEIRSKIIKETRHFFEDLRFLEVETPMMHPIPGGATARPFITHHNALDMPLYLRIAPELYLKRLVVGGFERVFEINRNFRNEGLSTRHNPEFTMLEFYQAYSDYHELMDLTEQLIKHLADSVLNTRHIQYGDTLLNLDPAFARMSVLESIVHFNPELNLEHLNELETAKAIAQSLHIPLKESYGLGKIQIEIFEKTVEHRLIAPTFITQYPVEVSPLSRRNDDNDFISDRFEFFMCGREIANGFSELNDPIDQADRFLKQMANKEDGDLEAMHFDADYIRALEYGMPPTAGEGIGIDRLVMLFTNAQSIRDVLLFPHLRPEEHS